MCNFFTCFSDGKGKVLMVKPEDIAKMIVVGNKDKRGNAYTPNSHSSYAAYLGIREDDYNKWEYNPETDVLTADSVRLPDDSEKVKKTLKKFFAGKDVLAMRNLYGLNSGHRNSGHRNSGHGNSGNWNNGDGNSGNGNNGDGNSGNWNSGNRNSGNWNSGNRNSGNWNASTTMSFFCAQDHYFMFDKEATKAEVEDAMFYIDMPLCVWISESDMTDQEKIDNPNFYVAGGYIKTNEYKEAWKLVSEEDIERIKKLPHFDAKVFEKITGLKV